MTSGGFIGIGAQTAGIEHYKMGVYFFHTILNHCCLPPFLETYNISTQP